MGNSFTLCRPKARGGVVTGGRRGETFYPTCEILHHLATVPAMASLLARIKAWDSSWMLSAENAPDLTALCRLLDGLPLALDLHGAR